MLASRKIIRSVEVSLWGGEVREGSSAMEIKDKHFIKWLQCSRRLHRLPQLPLRVGSDHIPPASAVRDLGIYIDSDVSMRSHVAKTVSACYSVLRQLRTIRRSVSRSVLQWLVSSLVLSRLDYGNSTLAGVSSHLLSRLQSVMNAAARLIFSSSRFQHITPLFRQLHWLKAPERIAFKQSVLVYKCLHGSAHLHTLLTSFVRWQMSRLVNDSVPVHLHH